MESFDKLDKIMMKREIKDVKRMRKDFVKGLKKETNKLNFLIIPDDETIHVSDDLTGLNLIMGPRNFKKDPILDYRFNKNEVINGDIKDYINNIEVDVELDISNITMAGSILSVIRELIFGYNGAYKELKKLKKKYKKLKMKKEKCDV